MSWTRQGAERNLTERDEHNGENDAYQRVNEDGAAFLSIEISTSYQEKKQRTYIANSDGNRLDVRNVIQAAIDAQGRGRYSHRCAYQDAYS